MNVRSVLLVLRDASIGLSIGAALRRRGLRVTTVDDVRDATRVSACDVVLFDAEVDPRGWSAFANELRVARPEAALVLLAAAPTFEDCRAALRIGLADVLAEPCGVDEVIAAIERIAPRHASEHGAALANVEHGAARAHELVVRRRTDADGVDAALRELLATLVRWSFGPSTRARVAAAVHELVDNVARHAYGDGLGEFELRATLAARELLVEVRDHGIGIDPHVTADAVHGLGRAAALAEDLRIDAGTRRGTRIQLRFAAWHVRFEEEAGVDLSELDYLTPELSARVLASLAGVDEPAYQLSPALAVSVGRLLVGPTHTELARTALDSAYGGSR
ncbi:MAG: ATP-binding protein [Planctomycetes bacterium]|nr:ATP-binding protein [Planctomycetota bacterium]